MFKLQEERNEGQKWLLDGGKEEGAEKQNEELLERKKELKDRMKNYVLLERKKELKERTKNYWNGRKKVKNHKNLYI